MLNKIGIVGGGTMGHGMAAAFAMSALDVNIFEPSGQQRAHILPLVQEAFDLLVEEKVLTDRQAKAAAARIHVCDNLKLAVSDRDFVVEAVPESLALKQSLFADLDLLCRQEAVLASNTSSLPLAKMMKPLGPSRRARTLVTHWYNPPLLMPIVELSFFGNMSARLYEEVEALHRAIGKQTVKVLKDVPGLVANRIQQAVAREVFSIIEQEIAAPEDVDRALKFGPAFRYATTGQLEVADFGGLDVWCVVGDNLLAVMDASKKANDMLRRRVAEGKLGVKSGEGFYKYDPDTLATVKKNFMKRLVLQLKASQSYI